MVIKGTKVLYRSLNNGLNKLRIPNRFKHQLDLASCGFVIKMSPWDLGNFFPFGNIDKLKLVLFFTESWCFPAIVMGCFRVD